MEKISLSAAPRTVALGEFPTPVARARALGTRIGADLWVKHEDLSSPSYGGNKVRKLEWLLGEALERGARNLITVGGIGSNHLLATAVHGRRLGLGTCAVVFPQPVTPEVERTARALASLGVAFRPCPGRPLIPLAMAAARRTHGASYVIGPGGSSPLGCLGWVGAALELADQIASGEIPAPDEIFLPLGSGGTVAGLLLGLALAGMKIRVVAVRVVERMLSNASLARLLALRTAGLLRGMGWQGPGLLGIGLPRLSVDHSQIGRGYGWPTRASREAVAIALGEEGLALEPTYTGKTFASLLSSKRGAPRAGRILFWNTWAGRFPEVPEVSPPASLPGWLEEWIARHRVEPMVP